MAIRVKEKQIGQRVRSTIDTRPDVEETPPAFLRDFLVTDWTLSFLLSPQNNELSPLKPVLMPFCTQAFIEVGFPSEIVGVGCPLNQAMSSDRNSVCCHQVDGQRFPSSTFDFTGEDPLTSADLSDPYFSLIHRRPLLECLRLTHWETRLEDDMIHFTKDF